MLYRFGEYVVDTARLELHRDDLRVGIEPGPLKLLIYLIQNRDRVVSRAELRKYLWGTRIVTDNSLSTCVKSARSAVQDSGRAQSRIRTVPGRGYRFVADVETSPHHFVDTDVQLSTSDIDVEGNRSKADPTPYQEPVSQPSIVVLPFEDLSGDASGLLFARGLVNDVIARLARSRTMFVIARGTTFNFPDGVFDVRTIGKKLGVRYVVQGAVQISGHRLKVDAALANASSRQEVWSWQYEHKLDDFMFVQEEIAEMIVSALDLKIQQQEVQRSLLMPSSNLDAWSAYHRGIHHMYSFKAEACDKAEYFFRRSIELEPGVPRPYAGLSFINFERILLGIEQDRAKGVRRALDYAMQSQLIDPLDPMGHWALSRAYLLEGELEQSKKELKTAIELNPSYAIAQYSLGWVALQLGENELCCDKIDLARKLSPYDPLKFAMLGVNALNLALMGETKRAAELSVQSTLQPNAHHQAIASAAVTHALAGQLDQAKSLLSRVRAIAPAYDINDFLAFHPFQLERDIKSIGRAFYDLNA